MKTQEKESWLQWKAQGKSRMDGIKKHKKKEDNCNESTRKGKTIAMKTHKKGR